MAREDGHGFNWKAVITARVDDNETDVANSLSP